MNFLEEKILSDGVIKPGNNGGTLLRQEGYKLESIAIIDEMDCETQTIHFRQQITQ